MIKLNVLKRMVMFVFICAIFTACSSNSKPSTDSAAAKVTDSKSSTAATIAPDVNKPVSITFAMANYDTDNPQVRSWVEGYKKKYPNVTVEVVSGDNDTYANKMLLAAKSNTLPDILWEAFPATAVPLINVDAVMDITPYVNADLEWKNRFFPGALEANQIKGKQYAIPIDSTLEGWFYNKQLFDKYNLQIPKTWDEFIKVVKTFKQNGIVPISQGAKDIWATWQYSYPLVSYGFFDQQSDILAHKQKFNNPQLVKALDRLVELRDAGGFAPNASTTTHTQAQQDFVSGKSPIFGVGTWAAGDLEKASFADDMVFGWGPTVSDGVGEPNIAVKAYSNSFLVGKNANASKEKMDAVLNFLKFISSPDGIDIQIKNAGLPPVKVDLSKYQMSNLKKQLFEKLADSNKAVPELDAVMPASFQQPFWNGVTSLLLGLQNPQQVLDQLDQWNASNTSN